MKKNVLFSKKLVAIGMSALLFATFVSGCGSSTAVTEQAYVSEEAKSAAGDNMYTSDSVAPAVAEEANAADASTTSTGTPVVDENAANTERKLIKNVSLDMETQEYDTLMNTIQARIKDFGGYVEALNAYNGSIQYESLRSASITARIPVDKLDEFIKVVGEVSNITNRSESVQDVTLQYVDMESHKKMLLEEQQRLMELLETAETMEDIIALESKLADVRYQIESMETQIRTYDNMVDYSTVYLNINEVELYTPEQEAGIWERIADGFVKNVYAVWNGVKNFFVLVLVSIPYLIVIGLVFLLLWFLLKAMAKSRRKKKEKSGNTSENSVKYHTLFKRTKDKQQNALKEDSMNTKE